MKTFTNIIYPVFAVLALACFAVTPTAHAVVPAPDGGYANETTAEGEDALLNLTTGVDNTALGYHALYLNTTGGSNTATGPFALEGNQTGNGNTAVGFEALRYSRTSIDNTAIGIFALLFDSDGGGNTAIGSAALASNIFGNNNTAAGTAALVSNNSGDNNTAIGADAMAGDDQELAVNSDNTAVGAASLYLNNGGNDNVGIGSNALFNNISGSNNTVIGFQALYSNTNGKNNTASGNKALFGSTTANFNTAVGNSALLNNTTGNSNVALGDSAGLNLTTGSNNIDIGNKGVAGEANTIRIGKSGTQTTTVIAGITGTTVPGGVGVIIGSNGKLGTVVSSAPFKEAIKPMDKSSEAILSLKPVTFRYKHELDPQAIPQFGLVAEQVEKVNPDLVARDEQGKPYTVRYEAVNAMLLNEFLKEHGKVQELETNAARQQKQIDALTAGLQKVSAQLEVSKPAPQVANNP